MVQLGSWETARNVRLDESHDLPGGTSLPSVSFSFGLLTKGDTANFWLLPQSEFCLFVCFQKVGFS